MFQFLNLSDPGSAVPSEPKLQPTRVGIARCLLFTIEAGSGFAEDGEGKKQDRDLVLCNKIVEKLRNRGLEATAAKRWKPWGAGTHIKFLGFELLFWLNSKGKARFVNCYVCTRITPRNDSYYYTAEWTRVRGVMEDILQQDLNAGSVTWMTMEQMEDRESADDSVS